MLTTTVGSLAASAAANYLSSNYSSSLGLSNSKKLSSYNAQLSAGTQFQLDKAESELNRRDYQWYLDKDYQYASNQYYNLARQYAENSASWSVKGLRNAGLNPILAATDGNFSGTYGGQQPSTSAPKSGGGGVQLSGASANGNYPLISESAAAKAIDTSAALISKHTRDAAVSTAYSGAQNSELQNKLLESQMAKIDAEADSARANTARTLSEIVDLKHGGKISGLWNLVGRSLSSWNNVPYLNLTNTSTDREQEDEGRRAGLRSFFENSAKSAIEELHKDEKKAEKVDKEEEELQQELEQLRKELESEQKKRRSSIDSIFTK